MTLTSTFFVLSQRRALHALVRLPLVWKPPIIHREARCYYRFPPSFHRRLIFCLPQLRGSHRLLFLIRRHHRQLSRVKWSLPPTPPHRLSDLRRRWNSAVRPLLPSRPHPPSTPRRQGRRRCPQRVHLSRLVSSLSLSVSQSQQRACDFSTEKDSARARARER